MEACKYCFRPITPEIIEKKKKLKSDNAKKGLQEAKARGKHIGRPYKHDVDKVIKLRKDGLSYGKIAIKLSLARSTVQYILNRLKGAQ